MLSKGFIEYLNTTLSNFLGEEIKIKKATSISGGSINQAFKLETSFSPFFLKVNQAGAFPKMFETELKGLMLLNGKSSLVIPKPLFLGQFEYSEFLLMEFLERGNPIKDSWENLGIGLAELHKNSQSSFGLNHDNYIGSLPQSNTPKAKWSEFFAFERLQPLVKKARNMGLLSSAEIEKFERLFSNVNSIYPNEPPSLIHGDLWSGNFMFTNDGLPSIFDPAIYFGHREMDLALSKLFGGFAPIFYDAYHHAYPLENGWKERVAISNLYPLLVHLILFGSSYLWDIKKVIKKF